ncbi:MAG: imidazolonepropionase [Bacteroidetes bacterium]|nr:imidazolonepropionase [Bacteroidota bacterium]
MVQCIINIRQLVNVRTENILLRGKALQELHVLNNAYLLIEDGLIKEYGLMKNLSINNFNEQQIIDAKHTTVLPCWCDSHTHLVFAATREEEFIDKIKGLSYADIAAKGGGILNSAAKLNAATEEDLYIAALKRLNEVMGFGTGAIEIKSGYGLTVDAELKMLRVIKALKNNSPIPIKATFLGAHTYPTQFKNNHQAYINAIKNEMLPIIAKENLADFIDVFCEENFFSVDETISICNAGKELGLKPKIHANQLSISGAVEAGVKLGAVSVDHLEMMDDKAINTLSTSNTIATLLPTAAFFLRMNYPPARELINKNAAVALASDYNPGSSPSGNMNFVNAISCIQMKMLPEEVINASTINGAYAMELEKQVGSVTVGKNANLIFTKQIPSLAYLPYSFGNNLIDKVMINGKFI